MNKKSNFFERLLQILDLYGIKTINSFAKDYLNYSSSEKINRLKDETKRPSYEILEDISNKFENIDMNWLVTGRGEMLRKSSENANTQKSDDKDYIIDLQKFKITQLEYDNKILKEENALLKRSINHFGDVLDVAQ